MVVNEQAQGPESEEQGLIYGQGRVPGGKGWLVAEPGIQAHYLVVPAVPHRT